MHCLTPTLSLASMHLHQVESKDVLVVNGKGESFCEDISEIFCARDVLNGNLSSLDEVVNVVVLDINVFLV
jgi:hypothetical protein